MPNTPESAARQIVKDLKGIWHGRYGKACCPAHSDRRASLSVTPGRKAVLFHCFAGCSQDEILAALKNRQMNPAITGRDTRPPEPARDLTPLCKQLWDYTLPLQGTPGQLYQEQRGIGHSRAGRFAPGAITYEGGSKLRLPALILPMTEGRELRALLRIFLDRDGRKSSQLDEPKRTLGDPRGSVVQLGAPASDTMNLAEGFEDAESAIVLNNLSGCAAVCGVERYASIFIPDHVRRVVIYSQHGRAAADAIERGSENLTANGRALEIVSPPPRCDWNDALMAKLKARA